MINTSTESPFPKNTRFLSIDYGRKRVGLATFYGGEDLYPVPFTTLTYTNDPGLVQKLLSIITKEDINVVVLGLPTLLDGKETNMTRTIRDFGVILQKALETAGCSFFWQDETLSSYEALDRLKKKAPAKGKLNQSKIDELAATVILEDFLKQKIPHAIIS